MKPALIVLGILGGIVLAGLPRRKNRAQSGGMAPTTRKLTRSESLRRAREASARRRAEDKADYAIAVKRCADLDSGRTKALSREEFLREMDLLDKP